MNGEADLTRLLAELKKSSSPLARLKTLSRAWRVVRRLSPEARGRLAAAVGLEGAEGLLESLSLRRGRLSPAVLQQALERVRGADPAAVQRVVRALRDGERRRQVFERGADALAAELGFDEEPPSTVAQPRVSPTPTEPPADTAPPALRDREPRDPEVETLDPSLVPEVTEAKAPRSPSAAPPAEVTPTNSPSPDAMPPADHEKTRAQALPTPPPSPQVSVSRRSAKDATELVRQLEAEPRTMKRFRRLREGRQRLRGQPVDLLRKTLALFPAGWQRRRALLYLLEVRVPDSPAVALTLIGELESPTGRRWCARTLVAEWDLSASERAAVRERFPGVVARPRRPDASRRENLRALK